MENGLGPWSDGGARSRLAAAWQSLGLSGQFLATAAAMLVCTSMIAGLVQARWIGSNLLSLTSETAAVYIHGVVAPHLGSIEGGGPLPEEEIAHLEAPFANPLVTSRIEALKIWLPDGTVIFSNHRDLIGQRFDNAHVTEALTGRTVVDQGRPHDQEGVLAPETGRPLTEFYVPIFGSDGSRVVAVGEIYQSMERTHSDFAGIIAGSWAIRAAFLGISIGILFLIVRRAGFLISAQAAELRRRYVEARDFALENRKLRHQAEEEKRNAVKSNEELISRIGSDLHDGPIQLMSLLMLRLGEDDDTRNAVAAPGKGPPGQASIRELSQQVMSELRDLSTGLILPEIEELSLEEAIRLAAARHERLTATVVDVDLRSLPAAESEGVKICLYRVVQEGLHNAFRHAQGHGQRIEAWSDAERIWLRVSDSGNGTGAADAVPERRRLGVLGLRNRVDALGGRLVVERNPQNGTSVTAELPRSAPLRGKPGRKHKNAEQPPDPAERSV